MNRLGNKILLAMFAVIIAVSASFLVYFISLVGNLLETRARNEGMSLVQNLAQSSELGILTEEERFLRGPFRGVLSNSAVVYAVAYDRDMSVVKLQSKLAFEASVPEEMRRRVNSTDRPFFVEGMKIGDKRIIDFFAPVLLRGSEMNLSDEFSGFVEEEGVPRENVRIGVVRIGMSDEDISLVKKRVIVFGISVGLGVVVLTTIVMVIFARRITRPLKQLREGASRVSKGDLDFQIRVQSRDEIGELAQSFNSMTLNLLRTTVSRDYLDNILGSMNEALVVVDIEGTIQTVNSALTRLLGYTSEDLIGRPLTAIVEFAGLLNSSIWAEFLRIGALRDFELNYVTKSGERIPMSFSAATMPGAKRGTRLIVGVARDMREIRSLMQDLERRRLETEQARNAAENEQRRLFSLVSSLNEGVIMFDPAGEVVVVNTFARRLLRFEQDAVIRRETLRTIRWLKIDELLRDVMSARRPDISREVELDFPIPQVIRIVLSQVSTEDQRELGFLMVLQDVTEERQLDRMRDEFVMTVSHDLRTPLTTIKGFVSLLLAGKGGELTQRQREFLDNIKDGADHLHSLINDLLDLSKIRAGKMVVTIVRADVRHVIEDAVKLNKPQADHKEIALTFSVPDTERMADFDFERIKEALNNLISNAVKFTPQGGSVTVEYADFEIDYEIKVSDTGPGIPKEYHEAIFDKFRSIPSGTEEISLSTGLGLAIVRGIVKAHRGSVWVESEPGHGATFIIRLPKQIVVEEVSQSALPGTP